MAGSAELPVAKVAGILAGKGTGEGTGKGTGIEADWSAGIGDLKREKLGWQGRKLDALAYLVAASRCDEAVMKTRARRHPLAFALSYKYRRFCPKKCAHPELLNVHLAGKSPAARQVGKSAKKEKCTLKNWKHKTA